MGPQHTRKPGIEAPDSKRVWMGPSNVPESNPAQTLEVSLPSGGHLARQRQPNLWPRSERVSLHRLSAAHEGSEGDGALANG